MNSWYVMIKAVGAHFSAVTGYPPASLVAEYGIYYTDFPPHPLPALQMTPKLDRDGLALPREYECHFRASLNIIRNQKGLRKAISSPIERRRPDVWWIGRWRQHDRSRHRYENGIGSECDPGHATAAAGRRASRVVGAATVAWITTIWQS